jgi:hypothetical protein
MAIRWLAGLRRTVVLRALLSLVLALAPVLAQITMAGHAAAADAAQATAAPVHDHAVHEHAVHNHNHDHERAPVDPGADHHPGTLTNAATNAAACPSAHADHDNGGTAGCCGTFCHSALALLSVPIAVHRRGPLAFNIFTGMRTKSVGPDQPDRPPSVPQSL